MTPRPEDVVLVNRAADMLVMQPVQAGYGAAQRLDTSNQLRSLASRLEGERRDGERAWRKFAMEAARFLDAKQLATAAERAGFSAHFCIAMQSTPTTPSEDRQP